MNVKRISKEIIMKEFSESEIEGLFKMRLDMEQKMIEPTTPMLIEITSYFKCKQCVRCCRESSPIMGDEELIAIAKKIGDRAFEALDEDILLNAFKTPCSFIEEQRCKIHDIKPLVCKLYPFSLRSFGFISLVLCPMGHEILKEINDFLRSKGVTEIRYKHNSEAQNTMEAINQVYEMAGCQKSNYNSVEIGIQYRLIPLFLKYLKQKYKK